jgi:methionyl-tRNA formyltransferase
MRVLLFANNRLGHSVTRWLRTSSAEIVGVVAHPAGSGKFTREIVEDAGVAADRVFDGSKLRQRDTLEAIASLRPQIGVSVLFGYILQPELIAMFPEGCINLHPALLPYNRGAYPNVWSIVDRTPAGVTIHYIDAGIDTGDIIVQRETPVEPFDTGATLYAKLEAEALSLFQETWPWIASGCAPRFPQCGRGTQHRVRDAERLDEIDLDRAYTGRELIDILRARTFPPYRGAFIRCGGRKVYISVQFAVDEKEPMTRTAGEAAF